MHNFLGSDLEVCTSRWYRILLFTQDFDFTVVSHSETSLSRLSAFPGYMQPAIWAMYVVMKLDARGAVMLNELTAVLLSGYILMETISAAVPWGGSLNNACESSGSQWPEAYPPLLLPLMAYPVRVTGQHVACWTVLHTAQTTAARFWFQKQSRAGRQK